MTQDDLFGEPGTVSVGLSITPNHAAEQVREIARSVPTALERGVTQATVIMEADLREVAMSGHPTRQGLFWKSPDGQILGRRSGQAVSSLVSRVVKSGDEVLGAVGSPLEKVLHHEIGGTVYPTTGKALAIPTVNATDNRGSLNNLFAGYGSLRDVPGLFRLRDRGQTDMFGPASGGRAWLVMRKGRRLEKMFLLVNSAEHHPKRFFEASMARVEASVVEAVGESVTLVVEKGGAA